MSATLTTQIIKDAATVLPEVPALVADAEGVAGQHGTSFAARIAAIEDAIGHISGMLGSLFPNEKNVQNVLQAAATVAAVASQVK